MVEPNESAELLSQWEKLATKLMERPFSTSIYNYDAEMDCREYLEVLRQDGQLNEAELADLVLIDSQFVEATVEDLVKPLSPNHNAATIAWWKVRRPKSMDEELTEDLVTLGYLQSPTGTEVDSAP